jgi:transcriptional regulator with XRE-family HTH domain
MDSILDIRKALGVSQVEMAQRLGLNQSTISRFERNEIVPDKRTMIAARALLANADQATAA